MPNVHVHSIRQTPIHKHREAGRWKLIEDELTARDLPITGSRLGGAKTVMETMGKGDKRKGRRSVS